MEDDLPEDSTPNATPAFASAASESAQAPEPAQVKAAAAPEEYIGAEPKSAGKPVPTLVGRLRTVAWELAKIVIIVLLLRAYVIQASTVDGNSMEPTLHGKEGVDQDYLLVERGTATMQNLPDAILGVVPDSIMPKISRGDIVVLASPENASNELVKRVVAIEGDYIFFFANELYVNGVPERELDYIPKNVETHHASTDIPDDERADLNIEDQDTLTDRARDRDKEIKRFKDAMRTLGSSEGFITRVGKDLGKAEYRRIGVRVPKDCVMVVGDNRGSGQSNDSRKWLEVNVNHSDDEKRLWAMRQQIHGRVVARLKMPWEYDATHPLLPK